MQSYVMVIILVPMALLVLSLMITKASDMPRTKATPFECGFTVITNPRLGFSIHFYMIAIVFLIFDVEIALLLPLPLTLYSNPEQAWWLINSIFMLTLLLGLLYELYLGSISWS